MALDKPIELVITSIVTVCVILVISIGCIALVLLYSCCLQRKTKKSTSSSDSQNLLKISYITLVKATDRFSSANLIGVGGSGSVLKGIIDEGERTVAVKVLNLVHHGAYKSFLAEYEALRNIRHRNLMKVLSVCSGFDCKNDDFKALIYEFMSNGSLDKWLHPSPTRTVAVRMDTPRSLNFSQRLNIAIDISMAVDYLHHHCETPIVHCDLKPSNILLNDDMVGHIGDFGLVRFLPYTCSGSVGLKGTIGYAPRPWNFMGNQVWTRGDVYSYGILLLEMFTGKRPTDNMFLGTSNLHNFVKAALPERMPDILDPELIIHQSVLGNLVGDENDIQESSSNIRESLISLLEIGVSCSAELPRERLDISNVVVHLCRIRSKLVPKRA